MIHGILDSADSFAIADDSIINFLLEKGFEVWAANNRGTKYGCTHETLKNTSKEFWDFSFDEFAKHDVPTFYKTALEISGAEKLTLIGHSQGTSQSFAALSESEELQSKTERFIALAPVVIMNRFTQTPHLLYWVDKFKVVEIFKGLGIEYVTLVDIGKYSLVNSIINLFCNKTSFVCSYLFHLTTDKDPEYLDLANMPRYLSYDPSGTSRKCFEHYTQLMFTDSARFQKFDYGKKLNMEKYGSKTPPLYDISKIKSKVSLFYGENDLLCTMQNIGFINDLKKDCVTYYMDRWGHLGYTWAKDKSVFLEKLDIALQL